MNIFHIACIVCTLSQYSPGTMDAVLQNRGMDDMYADGYLAVRDCQFIGQTVWLRPIGQIKWERFVVADCSMPPGTDGTYEWMTRHNIVGEIDHKSAVRWGVVGRAAKAQLRNGDEHGIRW